MIHECTLFQNKLKIIIFYRNTITCSISKMTLFFSLHHQALLRPLVIRDIVSQFYINKMTIFLIYVQGKCHMEEEMGF